jgi:glycine/D-amino acid oxidase-like deaminating enzyme
MAPSETADVVVVGGGVIGAAVTHYVAAEGLNVACFERGDLASGSSCACDGDVLVVGQPPGYKSDLTRRSQELLASLMLELEGSFDYKQRGSALVVETENDAGVAREWAERQAASGLPVRYVEGREILEQEPLLAEDIAGLVECSCDSSLNPMELVYGLARSARHNGAQVHLHSEVTRLTQTTDGRISGVVASGKTISAPVVVLAAGVWTSRLAETVGLSVPIRPRKGHLLVSERTSLSVRRKLMEFGYLAAKFGGTLPEGITTEMASYGIAMVIEPTGHQNLLVGSSREFAGFDTSSDPTVLRLMAQRALRFFPALREVGMIRSFAGLRPSTPDTTPIVSRVERIPGLYIASGHEGAGIALAPITGKLIAQEITGQPLSISLDPLRLERFDEGSGSV